MTLNPITGISEDVDATIASGASLSDGINLSGHVLTGIYMPAAWTAAAITFQASDDNSTWYNVYFEGAEVSITVAASQYIVLDPQKYLGIRHLKVRSGTSAAGVNQGADRTVKLIVGVPAT